MSIEKWTAAKCRIKFTYLIWKFADKDLWYVWNFFDPTASATAYGQRSKFVRAKHSATAEGENSAHGPTLGFRNMQEKLENTNWSISLWF